MRWCGRRHREERRLGEHAATHQTGAAQRPHSDQTAMELCAAGAIARPSCHRTGRAVTSSRCKALIAAPNLKTPKMLAPSFKHPAHVKCCICSERGNLPHRSQRDPARNGNPEEGLRGLPLRDRGLEEASTRARAPASASRQESRAPCSGCRERRLSQPRHSLQRKEHGVPTTSAWFVGSRMRSSHWRVVAVDLQLGGRQGTSARPTSTGDLCAQKSRSPRSEPDRRDTQSRLATRQSASRARDAAASRLRRNRQGRERTGR